MIKNSFVFLFITSTDFSNLLDTFIRLLIRNKLVSSFLTLISGFLRIVFQKGGEGGQGVNLSHSYFKKDQSNINITYTTVKQPI